MVRWLVIASLVWLPGSAFGYEWHMESGAQVPVGTILDQLSHSGVHKGETVCGGSSGVRDVWFGATWPTCLEEDPSPITFAGRAPGEEVPYWVDQLWRILSVSEVQEGVYCYLLGPCQDTSP